MMKRTHFALIAGIVVAAMCMPLPAQDAAEKPGEGQSAPPKNTQEKSAKEQTSSEKSKAESSSGYNSNNFPEAEGAVELRSARGIKVALNMSDSSRAVYEAIAKQGKINVIFDPDYTPRPVSVSLSGVSLQDALKIMAFESLTFWRPVTEDTIFVAADTQAKRHEFEQQVVKTFYLPNIWSSSDLQDVVNLLRTVVEVSRVQQMPGYQTVVIRATPQQLVLAEKLIDESTRTRAKIGGQYRLEFKVNEWGEDKKVASRIYSLLLEPHGLGKLRMGPRIPIEASDKDKTYLEAGKNIDCQVRQETEHTVSLRVTLELSDVAVDEHNAPEAAHGNPVLQQLKIETSATLELGVPSVIGSFQDPVSKRNFQIEATAVRAKTRE